MSASPVPHHAVDPSLLAPEYVRSLGRYVPGKPVGELAREFGLTASNIVKLASNENPRGPSPAVRAAIAAASEELCRYPDGDAFELKAALSARLRVSPFQLVLGNGSNDVLEMAARAFLACFLQCRRSQKAADMVGPEGRSGALGHAPVYIAPLPMVGTVAT